MIYTLETHISAVRMIVSVYQLKLLSESFHDTAYHKVNYGIVDKNGRSITTSWPEMLQTDKVVYAKAGLNTASNF